MVPEAFMVAVEGDTTMEVRIGTAEFTVKTAVLLVTPPDTAVILLVSAVPPVFLPVARPVESMGAAEVLLEFHVNGTPIIVPPN